MCIRDRLSTTAVVPAPRMVGYVTFASGWVLVLELVGSFEPVVITGEVVVESPVVGLLLVSPEVGGEVVVTGGTVKPSKKPFCVPR